MGRGCEGLGPADVRAIPPAGVAALASVFDSWERLGAPPWQLLLSLVVQNGVIGMIAVLAAGVSSALEIGLALSQSQDLAAAALS